MALKNFVVIELISSKTKAAMTVYTDRLKFNTYTAPDLDYTPYVQLLMDTNGKNFAIQACAKDSVNAVPFSRPKDAKPYPIVVRTPQALKQIRTAMGWDDPQKYYVVPGQKFYDEQAIVFNLNDAEEYHVTTRKGNDTDSESED